MNDFSIRSGQLNTIKKKYVLNDFLLFPIFIFLDLIILTIYLIGYIRYLNNQNKLSFFYPNPAIVIVIICLLIILLIPFVILCRKSYLKHNHKFHQMYLDYLFDECRLEEIYYKFRKKNLDNSILDEMEAYKAVKRMHVIYSLTDANPNYLLNYMQVKYIKDKEKQYGILLYVKTESYLDGYLQIRTSGESLRNDYDGKKIQRFGFTDRNSLSSFEVFSSLGSKTYELEKLNFSKLLSEYKRFIKSDFAITYQGSLINIFIEGFQFNLTSGYLSYKSEDFERRINSLIRLHKLTDELLLNLMSFKA